MENLVDEIIQTDYDNLKKIDLIMNKRFGLVVYKDGIKYEFLLNLLDTSDKLIVLGSGALGRDNTKFDRNKPIFSRWSWTLPESMINYNDPTLYVHEDIVSPWCVGTEDNWYLKNISLIIKIISDKLNVPNNKIIFSGSSAGGFTSLLLSILIKNSIAYVEIPQFNIIDWKDYFEDIHKHCFKESKSEIIKKWGYRFSFIQLMIKEKYIPNAYIYLDCSSEYDFKNQYMSFFKDLDKIKYSGGFDRLKLMIYGQNRGHDHFSIDVYKKMLNNILLDIDFNKFDDYVSERFFIVNSNNSQITFSDGLNKITLFSFQNKSVEELVDNYIDVKSKETQKIEKDFFELSNNKVIRTKLFVGDFIYVNYWFEKDNLTYQYHFNPINSKNFNSINLNNSISLLIKLNKQ